jgi:transcription antitermination factor NusG
MSSGEAVGMGLEHIEAGILTEPAHWYALRTRSRHEKMVADQLGQQGIENFLPLVKKTRQWSDRVKEVELPLFSGYTFVRVALSSPDRLRVLQTHGVAGLVGVRGIGVPIPEAQIESLKTVIGTRVPFEDHPFLQIGQRVRIQGGALDGIEGILSAHKGDHSLVISVEPIHRSLSICVEGYRVEPI